MIFVGPSHDAKSLFGSSVTKGPDHSHAFLQMKMLTYMDSVLETNQPVANCS